MKYLKNFGRWLFSRKYSPFEILFIVWASMFLNAGAWGIALAIYIVSLIVNEIIAAILCIE